MNTKKAADLILHSGHITTLDPKYAEAKNDKGGDLNMAIITEVAERLELDGMHYGADTSGCPIEYIAEPTDNMAERAVELGGVALGTIQIISKKSRLSSYPLDLASGQKHVAALSNALANCGASSRRAIDTASRAGDADTADLFTEVSRGIDKLLWLVEAHAQARD